MDAQSFDRLARSLSATSTRRGILSALAKTTAGTTLAVLVALPGSEETAASCRRIGDECTRSRQCCGHKKGKRVCALNQHAGAPTEPSCCIAKGVHCSSSIECCGLLECFNDKCRAI
jgi:hypothetical protein